MPPVGGELNQWSENESTEMKSRVRHGQSRLGQHEVVIQQEIEIEGPRTLTMVRIAPKCPLDLATDFQ